jgi:hypothetical protein
MCPGELWISKLRLWVYDCCKYCSSLFSPGSFELLPSNVQRALAFFFVVVYLVAIQIAGLKSAPAREQTTPGWARAYSSVFL